MKFPPIYKSLFDLPLKDYYEFTKESEANPHNEVAQAKLLLKYFCQVPEQEIDVLTFKEITEILAELGPIITEATTKCTFERDKTTLKKKLNVFAQKDVIVINGVKFKINTDLSSFPVAQYIDLTNLMGIEDVQLNHPDQILSVLLIPFNTEKKKFYEYNEGYDFKNHSNWVLNNVSMEIAQTIIGFFLMRCLTLSKRMLTSLNVMIKTPETKKRIKAAKTEIEQLENQIRQVTHGSV